MRSVVEPETKPSAGGYSQMEREDRPGKHGEPSLTARPIRLVDALSHRHDRSSGLGGAVAVVVADAKAYLDHDLLGVKGTVG